MATRTLDPTALTLQSPRFVGNATLQEAAVNSPPLGEGNAGHAVHLIQTALLDLGYDLPRSTPSRGYSPDGIYGEETVSVVRRFQRDRHLTVDGVAGEETMSALDAALPGYGREVKLHYRSVGGEIDGRKVRPTAPGPTVLQSIQDVYRQYGIRVSRVSAQSVMLSPSEVEIFRTIDTNYCAFGHSRNADAHALLDRRVGMSPPIPRDHVLVYLVDAITGPTIGLGATVDGRPVCIVCPRPSEHVTAHEIGHALQRTRNGHVADRRNLMYAKAISRPHLPALQHQQLRRIRSHPACRPV